MAKTYQYDVQGRGRFPLDMLRYDCAWPKTPNDVILVAQSWNVNINNNYTVRLRSDRKPTVDRWKSFGFPVTEIYIEGR